MRLLRKIGLLRLVNINAKLALNNKKITVPVMGEIGIGNFFISEKWMSEVIEKISLPSNEIFVDIGVNIGQTLIQLKSVQSDVDYIGFEPNTACSCYSQLLANVNNWMNVTIIPAGISAQGGFVDLESYADNPIDSSASIVSGFRNSPVVRKQCCVCCDSSQLEGLFADKQISAIKIDVEGAELEVVKAFEKIIIKNRPKLLVEILPVYTPNSSRMKRQEELESLFKEIGYIIYRINKDQEGNFRCFKEIESIGVHDRLDWCDYLFSSVNIN